MQGPRYTCHNKGTEGKMVRYLFDIVWSVLFQIYRPPDLQVGLTIQIGGLDETDLQGSKQGLHTSCRHAHVMKTAKMM